VIQVSNISSSYGNKQIIKNVSFDIEDGSILSILGVNGSGKTTLLKSIVGILDYKGDVFINKKNIKSLNKKQRASLIAYVSQKSFLPFDFTVLEIVLMGRFHNSSFGFNYKKEDTNEALKALEQVGIKEFKARIFKNLSGGEKQLVLIARALAQKSKIIIMDEPVTGLDLGNQMKLLELINTLIKNSKIVIQTTHYPNHALRVSNKVLWLNNGEVLAFGKASEVITTQRIREVYALESKLYVHEGSGLSYILPLKLKEDD